MTRSLALLLFFLIGGAAWAEGLAPELPKAKGEACVRDTPFMRKNHMELLLHQRDLTMYQGIRPKNERLNACVSCHAVEDTHGKAVSFEDPKHFCRTCHDFTAVQVDCFECHSSTPEQQAAKGGDK